MQRVKPRVLDRHINLTKYGFPSTREERNNNAIINSVMKDADPEIENENLVQKTNHMQNAVKMTRNTRGSESHDMDIKKAANIKQNTSDLTGTMDRIYE